MQQSFYFNQGPGAQQPYQSRPPMLSANMGYYQARHVPPQQYMHPHQQHMGRPMHPQQQRYAPYHYPRDMHNAAPPPLMRPNVPGAGNFHQARGQNYAVQAPPPLNQYYSQPVQQYAQRHPSPAKSPQKRGNGGQGAVRGNAKGKKIEKTVRNNSVAATSAKGAGGAKPEKKKKESTGDNSGKLPYIPPKYRPPTLETDEEIEKWRAERRKKWPSDSVIKQKMELKQKMEDSGKLRDDEKEKDGRILNDKNRKRSKNNKQQQRQDKQNAKRRKGGRTNKDPKGGKSEPTLLQKLLKQTIENEQSLVLQCLRRFAENDFYRPKATAASNVGDKKEDGVEKTR
jgi:hypothetical protein